MARSFKTILVTGGAGFIGSNLIHYLFGQADFKGRVINLDALTYAGNLESLADIEERFGASRGAEQRYFFVKADICDRAAVEQVFADHAIDAVCHLAAESHVDRSILGPEAFIKTNVMGTFTLLDVARTVWKGRGDVLFHHVSHRRGVRFAGRYRLLYRDNALRSALARTPPARRRATTW